MIAPTGGEGPTVTGAVPVPHARAGAHGTLPTGHPDVDSALDELVDVDSMPSAEQVERYAEVHRALQQTLRTIDAA